MDTDITILYRGDSGKLLRRHIEFQIDALDKVSDISKDQSLERIAIDALVKQETIAKLKEIFKLTTPEPKDTVPDLSRIKKRNGL